MDTACIILLKPGADTLYLLTYTAYNHYTPYTVQPGDDFCPYLRNKHCTPPALPREFLSIQHLGATCVWGQIYKIPYDNITIYRKIISSLS